MIVKSPDKYDVIELQIGETLIVSSTYEMIKKSYSLKNLKAISIKVYDNFFIVEYTDKSNNHKQQAFSDTWDFSIL